MPIGPSASRKATSPTVDTVYQLYSEYVFRVVRRLGVSEAQVEDAVQDVFLVVLRRAPDFEGRSSVRTWVFGIALRVARAYRRKAARAHSELSNVELASRQSGPDAQAAVAQEVRLLMALLKALPDEQREVFVLSEIEGLTAPEVAAVVEIPLNTVYSRLRLGRERFQSAYRRVQRRELGGVS